MGFPKHFTGRTKKYSRIINDKPVCVNAPLLRKTFCLSESDMANIRDARMLIGCPGFYVAYINGKDITKGFMSPYRGNPSAILYYDEYNEENIVPYLKPGKNVIAFILGNGSQNCLGAIWDYGYVKWRGAPEIAFSLYMSIDGKSILDLYDCDVSWDPFGNAHKNEMGWTYAVTSASPLKTYDSPILFNDIYCGEYYDARLELNNWNMPDYDDSYWDDSIEMPIPVGEERICNVHPIKVIDTLKPVKIVKEDNGFRYDFERNSAGVYKLRIKGIPGQRIELRFGEILLEDRFYNRNIKFSDNDYIQKDIYICKGNGIEEYIPKFTYHGFQYVLISGINAEQANEELLTYLVMSSLADERGNFYCSDNILNCLQSMTRVSDLSNFFHYPTDCPHREKNGWTGDAALSAEQMLINFSAEDNYKEWIRNICKHQTGEGALPGIVPTAGWSYSWGNGPAWDAALIVIPYFVYVYRGDTEILNIAAPSILRYLGYISSKLDERDLVSIGLGDWCPPGRGDDQYKSPLVFTDSVITMDNARKAAYIFDVLGMKLHKEFALTLSKRVLTAVRKYLIDDVTLTALGNCQTSQAMGIYYGIFTDEQLPKAFDVLLRLINETDCHIDTGVLGARVIFHVLSSFERSDIAYKMISRTDFPSYGNWVKRGATSLWENMQPEGGGITSHNHHFWGDISNWFISCIAGIRYNPDGRDHLGVNIIPSFISDLTHASAFHICPAGRIISSWKRVCGDVCLSLDIPEGMHGHIYSGSFYSFDDGSNRKDILWGHSEYMLFPHCP